MTWFGLTGFPLQSGTSECARGCRHRNVSKRPTMLLIWHTNSTKKVDVKVKPAARSVTFRLTRGRWRCFNHFLSCWVSKMSVLIFVNERLSWLIGWCYWPASQWHAVWWCHTLVPAGIVWNPGRAGTKKVSGTSYYDLMENAENHGEPCWVDPSRY